jgi:UDP-N-acetylmuramyl pentapeptide phosphotransferase/UDP-N-acetylglucosamine-1-phosphate transferase
MNHAFHLFIKFLLTSFILYGILGFVHGVDYTVILFTSVVLALIGYIGDLFLLPRLGNVLTTLSDFLIAFLIVWGIGTYLFDYDIGTQNYKANLVPLFEISLTIGIFYAVVDWFYHRWLFKFLGKKEVFPR